MTQPVSQDRRTPAPGSPPGERDPNRPASAAWIAILECLRAGRPDLFRGWFQRLIPRPLCGGVLTIDTENETQAQYLETRCREALTVAAQQTAGRLISLVFAAPPTAPGSPSAPVARWTDPPLDSSLTFDTFVTGPCNRLAHAAAKTLAVESDPVFRVLYLYGASGTGKTHLLQAICHSAAVLAPIRWRFIDCGRFCTEWIEAVEQGSERAFRQNYRGLDLLVLDKLDEMANRTRSQEEFFHTFNTLQELRAKIAVAAVAPPHELPNLEPRLRDRFAAGFVAPLDPPCRETRPAIVRSLARSRCIDVPDKVAIILAEWEGATAADLGSALAWLEAQSQTVGGRMTEGLARTWLDSMRRSPGVSETTVFE